MPCTWRAGGRCLLTGGGEAPAEDTRILKGGMLTTGGAPRCAGRCTRELSRRNRGLCSLCLASRPRVDLPVPCCGAGPASALLPCPRGHLGVGWKRGEVRACVPHTHTPRHPPGAPLASGWRTEVYPPCRCLGQGPPGGALLRRARPPVKDAASAGGASHAGSAAPYLGAPAPRPCSPEPCAHPRQCPAPSPSSSTLALLPQRVDSHDLPRPVRAPHTPGRLLTELPRLAHLCQEGCLQASGL